MTPEPYKSKWCETTHYLLKALIRGQITVVVCPNGVQPIDGHRFVSMRDAKAWLSANGFEKVTNS